MVERDTPIPRDSKPWKINSARSAAPAEVSRDAHIIDLTMSDTARGEELALGGNGWVCWPDNPATPDNDPICEDEGGREWTYAMQGRRAPRIATMGTIYQLQGSADGPYVGIVPANPQRVLAGLPTTKQADQPWVKYAGTPWAFLVVPTRRMSP